MISEGWIVCDDAQGVPTTSPFELYKPGDRRNVFRFRPAVTSLPASSTPVPGTLPFSSVAPPGAPPADVPTPFPGVSRSARNLAAGRCACYAGLRRSPVRTRSPPGIHATPRSSTAPTTGQRRPARPSCGPGSTQSLRKPKRSGTASNSSGSRKSGTRDRMTSPGGRWGQRSDPSS